MESGLQKRGLSQEGLKLLACLCMLIDHTASAFFKSAGMQNLGGIPIYLIMRGIGRLAFPIYCWLMAEGIHYTKNPKKYALRLFIGILLSELPFDLALKGGFTWKNQSVMVTLFLGFAACELIEHTESSILKILATLGAFALGVWAKCDYGGKGVLLIILMAQARGKLWLQTILTAVMCWVIGGLQVKLAGISFPIEMYGVLAMIPIALCSGQKRTHAKSVQIAFYLFYPVHLAILWLLKTYLL